jgi:hypothetical protein
MTRELFRKDIISMTLIGMLAKDLFFMKSVGKEHLVDLQVAM